METIVLASLVFLALVVLVAILNTQRKVLNVLKNPRTPEPPEIKFPKIEIPPAKEISLDLDPVIKAIDNIRFPQPEINFPKIEIPPAKEVILDLNPVIEAIDNIRFPQPEIEFPKIEIPPANEVVLDLNPVTEAINNIKEELAQSKPKEIMTTELLQNLANAQDSSIKALHETSTMMRVNQAEFQSGLEAFHKAIEKLLVQIPGSEKELDIQKEFMQKFEETFIKVQETAAETMNSNSLRLQEILTEFLNKEANR